MTCMLFSPPLPMVRSLQEPSKQHATITSSPSISHQDVYIIADYSRQHEGSADDAKSGKGRGCWLHRVEVHKLLGKGFLRLKDDAKKRFSEVCGGCWRVGCHQGARFGFSEVSMFHWSLPRRRWMANWVSLRSSNLNYPALSQCQRFDSCRSSLRLTISFWYCLCFTSCPWRCGLPN